MGMKVAAADHAQALRLSHHPDDQRGGQRRLPRRLRGLHANHAGGGDVRLLVIGGFFRSLQFTAINTIAYAEVEQSRVSRATALVSVGQQLSISAGVALGALAVDLTAQFHGHGDVGGRRLPAGLSGRRGDFGALGDRFRAPSGRCRRRIGRPHGRSNASCRRASRSFRHLIKILPLTMSRSFG